MDRRAAPRRSVLKRDHELEVGSRAHYDDPTYYTHTYRSRIEDVAFYVEAAAEHVRDGGAILEYGVGNGRVALPLARHGFAVTGVDHSAPMLADLRRRLAEEHADVRKRVRLVRGDMRRAKVGRRFPLVICPFNAALHLYERADVEAFFARVRAHLAPGGRFLVDLSVPIARDLARDPARAYGAPSFTYPGEGRVKYLEHFDYDPARQVLFISMHFTPIADPSRAFWVPLAHRQFYPREWEALLHYNGFEAVNAWGDFQRGPLTRDSDVMIWEARARRRG
jgi:SAM-dependent methyltransferase